MIKCTRLLFTVLCIGMLVVACQTDKESEHAGFEQPDVSAIPDTTVALTDTTLKLDNGIFYLKGQPYSGFIREEYLTGDLLSVGSYFNGKQHGITKSFYPNGKPKDERSYRENFGYGRHFGYWGNGNKKFDFFYVNDKREGTQKQWYESGEPYCELSYKDDREDGMQKAWRENGKPYINYEVKEGRRYGLQKAGLCYTLKKGEIKSAVYETQD